MRGGIRRRCRRRFRAGEVEVEIRVVYGASVLV